MANKVFRLVQDKLNRLTTTQLERYGQELSGQLAIIIFDKEYKIVEATLQPGIITFTAIDYKHNKKIFDERARQIGDKSIMFDVRHKTSPYHYESWERIDLAFEGDYILYKDEYAKITEITDKKFSIKKTESDEELTFIEPFGKELFSDFLVEINARPLRAAEEQPEPEPQPEKTPMESGEHLLEFMDGEVDYVDRKDFCVIGDKVRTSYGDGQITDFNTELGHVFLKRLDNSMNFHCLANEVVQLIDQDQDQDEDDDQDNQDENKICKSVELYEQLTKNSDNLYAYRLCFDENDTLYSYYYALRQVCYFNMDLGVWCFSNNQYQDWMSEFDKRIFKYLILIIKNNPKYFEEKGYEVFYFDKLGSLLKSLTTTNKIATGTTDYFQFFLYAIGENRYHLYMVFENKDGTFDFEVVNDRIIAIDKNKGCTFYENSLSYLLSGNYDLKEVSETPLYKKMEIFINLVES